MSNTIEEICKEYNLSFKIYSLIFNADDMVGMDTDCLHHLKCRECWYYKTNKPCDGLNNLNYNSQMMDGQV